MVRYHAGANLRSAGGFCGSTGNWSRINQVSSDGSNMSEGVSRVYKEGQDDASVATSCYTAFVAFNPPIPEATFQGVGKMKTSVSSKSGGWFPGGRETSGFRPVRARSPGAPSTPARSATPAPTN